MRTFIKFQASSLISTVVDYSVTLLLTENLKILYIISSVIGFVSGGVTNFLINKNWVFKTKSNKNAKQVFLYLIVWIGNLLINTFGIYILTDVVQLDYKYSKIIVSVIVGFVLMYFAQKKFVFYSYKNER